MNKKEEIKKQLTEWFNIMLAKYTWLKIKYEYNEAKECYLVSFYSSSDIEDSDFDKDVLEFEEIMDNKYEDYSPLFCDNERLFKLSPKELIRLGIKDVFGKSGKAEELMSWTPNIFANEAPVEVAKFDLDESFVSHNNCIEASQDEFDYLMMAA